MSGGGAAGGEGRAPWLARFELMAGMGATRAAHALSSWLGRPAAAAQCVVEQRRLDELGQTLEDGVSVAVAARVSGGIAGCAALFFAPAGASALIAGMGAAAPAPADGDPVAALTEAGRPVLEETGNIVICAFLNALAASCAVDGIPSPPACAVDIGGAAWDALLLAAGARSDVVLAQALLTCPGAGVAARLVFVPDDAGLALLRDPVRDGPA